MGKFPNHSTTYSRSGMKLTLLFVVFLKICCHSSCASTVNKLSFLGDDNLLSALQSYFNSTSIKSSHHEILLCENEWESLDLTNKFLSGAAQFSSTFQVESVSDQSLQSRKAKAILIFCGNSTRFVDLFKNVSWENVQLSAYFTLVVKKYLTVDLEEFFHLLWSKYIYNFNVLIEAEYSSQIFTFLPFDSEKCNDVSQKLLGEFVNNSWTMTKSFFRNKFENLQSCRVKISAVDNAPVVIKRVFADRSYALDGIEVKFIRETAKVLNFVADIESEEKEHGAIFEVNRTATGNIKHAILGKADMVLGSYYLTRLRSLFLSHTQPYRWDSMRIVGAPAKLYTPLEKLLRPFDCVLFAALAGILLVGFVCLFMLQKSTDKIVSDPSTQLLNLLTVFIGGAQSRLPRKTFLRVLFFSFAFFCLIIRTIYQGSLFTILQSDSKKKGITSIDAMVEQKFTFYVSTSVGQTTQYLKFFSRQEIVTFDKLLNLVQNCHQLEDKEVILASENDAIAKFDLSRCTVLNEPVIKSSVALFWRKNHFLLQAVDEEISLFKSAGLIDFWISNFDEEKEKRANTQSKHLKILSLFDLSGAFIVWTIGLFISTAVAVVERMLIKPLEKLCNRFKP